MTRAIASLEERLGTRLFHRTTRSVSLTSAGERYLERSRRAVAEFDCLEASEGTREFEGSLTVTAPVLFGQMHVLPLVTRFLATHRKMSVRLLLVDRVVSLADEGVDVALRMGALADSSLVARRVGHVRTVLCASPSYLDAAGLPRRPGDLSKHACIAFTGTTPIVDRWPFPASSGRREQSVPVKPRLIVNTGQAAIEAAVAGVGLVRVLSYQVQRLVSERTLRVVLAEFEPEPTPVHLVHLPGIQPRAAVAFSELSGETLRATLGTMSKEPRSR